ncbi:uncharacterized protein LOC121879755 [Homarus americanus]|uniref:uncharacterized protein LOC121879755 n=1 Tax=Homarus americanus TaxID=6706 RepID=UPI001C46EAB5|nr:uncharacterized protein LOC121879755 [Homarus americanus]
MQILPLVLLAGFVVGAPSNNGFVRHAAPYSSYITYGQTKPPPYSSPRRRVNHKDFMQNALKKQAMLQRQQQMILQEVRELKQQLDSNSFTAPSARSTIHLNKPAELTSLSYTIADIIKQLTGNTNPGLRIPTPDLLPGKINLLVATDPHDDDSEEVTQPLLLAPRPPVTHVFITSDPQERSTPAFRFSEPDSQEQLKSLDGVVSLVEDSYTDDSEEESTGRKIQIENIPTQDQAASEALIEVLEPNTTPDVVNNLYVHPPGLSLFSLSGGKTSPLTNTNSGVHDDNSVFLGTDDSGVVSFNSQTPIDTSLGYLNGATISTQTTGTDDVASNLASTVAVISTETISSDDTNIQTFSPGLSSFNNPINFNTRTFATPVNSVPFIFTVPTQNQLASPYYNPLTLQSAPQTTSPFRFYTLVGASNTGSLLSASRERGTPPTTLQVV